VPGEVVTVRSRGLRAYPPVLRVFTLAFGALGVWLTAISDGFPHSGVASFEWGVLGLGVVMLLADLGLEEYFSNNKIEIGHDGITAVYRFHRRFAPWSKLTPLKDSILNQTGFLFDRGRGRRTQLIVMFEQMRAVLAHPDCPKWTLAPGLAQRLASSRNTA